MPDSQGWPPKTVRAAITAAQASLDNVRPEDELTLALAALECAIELLDASGRELGAFRDWEPYRLVLDPLPRREAMLTPPVTRAGRARSRNALHSAGVRRERESLRPPAVHAPPAP